MDSRTLKYNGERASLKILKLICIGLCEIRVV